MKETMKLEMKIISKETIKPSSPTPSHLETLQLSLFDQLFPAIHLSLLLFYNAPSDTDTDTDTRPLDQITNNLKSSLSETLSQFYPLAGRCIDEDSVSCKDQGIPLIETHVNSRLTEFLASSHKLDLLSQLLPPQEILTSGPLISDMLLLAFQINVFACGGIVIGAFMNHKLLDMSSYATFYHNWAAVAAQRYNDVVDPNFNLIFKGFPPLPLADRVKVVESLKDTTLEGAPPVVVLVKSFRFTKTAINDLKVMAATEVHPNPTTFETLSGFTWESVVAAGCIARAAANEPVSETTAVSMSINMRTRTKPPLDRNSIGNCAADFLANATRQATLPELVGEIHSTILEAKQRIEAYLEVNGLDEILKDRMAARQSFCQANPNVYHVSSCSRLGLTDADFGFGKPNWIVPTNNRILPMIFRNFIVFIDYHDDIINGQGMEAWLYLEEKEMQVLETNPRFLQFASPF